jgi:PAS domain S-box-containing protein
VQKRPSGEFENVTVAALVVGSDGTVSSANPAAHRMLGYPAGALRGQVFAILALGLGEGAATVLTCDLTHGYITINADYTT